MNSIWTRIFAVLVLAWLVTAVPIPVPATTSEDVPATGGPPATRGVGVEPRLSNAETAALASQARKVTFGSVTLPSEEEGHARFEPKLPASDDPRLAGTKSAIRLPTGAESPSRSSLPTVEYEGGSLKAPDSASRINAGPANSDWEMARLLERRPLNAQTSRAVQAMTSNLPEFGYTAEDLKPIMTLSGEPELDSAALASMTKEGVPFYVENGQGKIWEFKKTGDNGGYVFTSALGESVAGVPDEEGIKAALAESRSPLSDAGMSRLLAARSQSVYPSDELRRRVNNLPIFKQRTILTLSGDFHLDSTALAEMTRRGQPFYVTDGKGNVGAFVGETGSSEGLAYRGQVGEDTRQGVMQAVGEGRQAAETSVAAASSRGLHAEESAVARGTNVPQEPRVRISSPFPRPIVPQRAQTAVPSFKSWRTYAPFVKDPVQKVTTSLPKVNGVPILRHIEDERLRAAALQRMYQKGGSFFAQKQDGSFASFNRPVRHGTIVHTAGDMISQATQQQLRQALEKPNSSWWSRVGENARNLLGRVSSSSRQYFHGA